MDEKEITSFVIHRLSDGASPDDITLEICQKADMRWPEAEALVKRVQDEHQEAVTRKQSPLLALIAFFIFAGGVGIVIYSLVILVATIQVYTSTPVDPIDLPNAFQAIGSSIYLSFGGLIFGSGMIMGSMLGMRNVWSAILYRDKGRSSTEIGG